MLILNDVAWSIVEARRGVHKDYVFTYAAPGHEPGRVDTMNSAAFQKARANVGFAHGSRARSQAHLWPVPA
ncbi:MAG TPA: hypothetical protein VLK85_34330 [Ramlibacter sp.]|nr:hypothetical protein [Ramlibacter sp.]